MSDFHQNNRHRKARRFITCAIIALTALPPVTRAASSVVPNGGAFTAGSGNIAAAGNILTINQSTLHGIIDWNNFSIGKGGVVTFNNGAGATLNRVTGGLPSFIMGQLLASGSVYLINPQGVLIGHGATVHTGGDFLASTLNLSNGAFLKNGALLFSGASNASVVNLGELSSSGGSVYLIGRTVRNGGSVRTPNGTAGLAAGSQVLLADSAGDQRIFVQAPGGDVTNSGFITAAQVELKSNGGNIYALAGNTGGQIRATGTATREGHVWLIAENGTTNASGLISASNANGTGGAIETSGAHVTTSGAQIATGKGGNWLLDPDDLTIDSTLAGTIEGTLNSGTNVTEQTAAPVSGGNGDITVASNIAWTSGASLTLSAYRDIAIDTGVAISNTGAGNLTLRADNSSSGIGTISFADNTAKINFSGSTGYAALLYNPTSYLNPTSYASNFGAVHSGWTAPVNGSVSSQYTAYMLVNDPTDLQNVQPSGNYALGTDIVLVSNFAPLATNFPNGFSGIFDGQGHTIDHLTINDTSDSVVGLFGMLGSSSIIRNLNLTAESVTAGGGYIGGLVGYSTGIVANVTTAGTLSVASTGQQPYVGGIAGINGGTLRNSSSSATVGVSNDNIPIAAGGLAGLSFGSLSKSYATGAVSVATPGIASHYSAQAGGLVGISSGSITSSYASGAISAGGSGSAAGGLVGQNNSSITTSYATGAVSPGSGGSAAGGLVGAGVGTVTNSYWDITTSGQTVSAAGTGLTTLQWLTLGPAATHATGWDFTTTWVAGYPYPVLKTLPYVLTTFNAGTQIYGGAAPAITIATTLDQNGNNATNLVSGSLTLVTGLTTNVGQYHFGATGQSVAPGYQGTYLGSLNITPATLTYTTGAAASTTYGSSIPAFSGTLTGFVNADTQLTATTGSAVFASQATATSNVGTYAVNGSGLTADNGNYLFVQAAGNASALTINPALLTYTAASGTRPYGSANPAFSGTVSGFVLGQTQTSATTGPLSFTSPATPASNVGVYAVNGSGLTANNGNYTFTQLAGNATALTINPALLTYTTDGATRSYGASTPAFSGTVSGFVLDQTQTSATAGLLSFTSPATAASNVGVYAVNGSGLTANNGNYTFTQAAGNATALTINPALLTYTADGATRSYGASNPAFSGTVSGFVNNQNSSVLSGTLAWTSPASETSNVGTYGITGSGLTGANYQFVQGESNTSALTINPATLTYASDPTSRPAGTVTPTFTGSVTGFVNGQSLASATTGNAVFASLTDSTSVAGNYAINGAGLTADHGNYVFTQAAGNSTALTVTAAAVTPTTPLAISVNNLASLSGQANPTFTATYTGPAISGLNVTSLLAGLTYQITPALTGPGTYRITASGTAPAGFVFNFLPGTFTVIDSSPQTIPSDFVSTNLLVPVLLPAQPNSFSGALEPVNALGLFQITLIGVDSSFSPFAPSLLDSQEPPLAESSVFAGPGHRTKYVAGAKP